VQDGTVVEAGSTYVALGSSFAAGPGIPPVADAAARRSERNYARLVAGALSLRLVDVTYSGATTGHLLRERQDSAPPQIEAVGPDARLVTITVGGNDLGYVGGLIGGGLRGTLAAPVRPVSGWLADRIAGSGAPASAEQVDAVAGALAEVVARVRERAPQARVVLVDYLTLVGEETRPGPGVPLTPARLDHARATAAGLAAAFARAATDSGADLVAASAASAGHAIGSADPWVTGFSLRGLRSGPAPFHPTASGMAAVADLVTGLLGG
jgi:lysophospholipase L1-like esterase